MTRKITIWTLLSLCLLLTISCEFNDKDASKDFEYRVNYLKTLILVSPPYGPHLFFRPRPEDCHGYGSFEYEIYKTESITRPYRAELAFAYLEKTTNQNYQVVQEYKAIFTHSDEAKSWWKLESMEERSTEENSKWEASSELDHIEFWVNYPKKIIRSDMKKYEERRKKSRKLMQKIQRRADKKKNDAEQNADKSPEL